MNRRPIGPPYRRAKGTPLRGLALPCRRHRPVQSAGAPLCNGPTYDTGAGDEGVAVGLVPAAPGTWSDLPVGLLKVDRLHGMRFATRRQAKDEVMDWIGSAIIEGCI